MDVSAFQNSFESLRGLPGDRDLNFFSRGGAIGRESLRLEQSSTKGASASESSAVFESVVHDQVDRLELSGVAESDLSGLTYADLATQIQDKYGVSVGDVFGGFLRETDAKSSDPVDGEKLADYFAPENSSERIVRFAVSFMDSYAAIHADTPKEKQLAGFRELIEGAVDRGFGEAEILFGDLPDEVKNRVEETRTLVSKKLDDYFNRLKNTDPSPSPV